MVASPQWKKLKKKVMKLRKEKKELKKELNRARKVLEVEQAVVWVLEQSLVLECQGLWGSPNLPFPRPS